MTASQIKLQTEFVNGYVNDVTEMLCFVVMYTQKSKDYDCTSHTVRSLVKKCLSFCKELKLTGSTPT